MTVYFWMKNIHLNGSGAQLDTFWTYSLYAHIVSWIAQFIGHGAFEKRNPALLDNLLLTLVAPDFVIIEVMFFLGWNKDVYNRCKIRIEKNIKQFKAEQAKKSK